MNEKDTLKTKKSIAFYTFHVSSLILRLENVSRFVFEGPTVVWATTISGRRDEGPSCKRSSSASYRSSLDFSQELHKQQATLLSAHPGLVEDRGT